MDLKSERGETVRLQKLYSKEQSLRKKYWNEIEDMKGKIRVCECLSAPLFTNSSCEMLYGKSPIDVDDGVIRRLPFLLRQWTPNPSTST